jgi:hypothetical protein
MLFEKKNQLFIIVAAIATIGIVAVYLKPLQKLVSAPFPVEKPSGDAQK